MREALRAQNLDVPASTAYDMCCVHLTPSVVHMYAMACGLHALCAHLYYIWLKGLDGVERRALEAART